jgi:hypothetical protein
MERGVRMSYLIYPVDLFENDKFGCLEPVELCKSTDWFVSGLKL